MTAAQLSRPRSGLHANSLAGRFLAAYLISLLLHGLLLFGLTGNWLGSPSRLEPPPVYYVDLVHKPVLNPQAGRPEPRASQAVPEPPKATEPNRLPLPAKTAPRARTGHVQDALEKLREEQALQRKFAALRQAQAVPMDAPAGLPDARGNEAGVTSLIYVQATIQQNWALSPYLLADKAKMAKIEAWVQLTYGKSGRLEGFRFERGSGVPQFDESIKRALVKSQQLPNALPVRLEEVRVIFNLKALAEMRR
jgi:hypothetical protein